MDKSKLMVDLLEEFIKEFNKDLKKRKAEELTDTEKLVLSLFASFIELNITLIDQREEEYNGN